METQNLIISWGRSNLENREDYGTALSKYVWFLKDNDVRFDLKWSIKKKAQVYTAGAKYCDLCLTEKTIIMLADKNCINIRTEILRKCPHIRKFTLGMVKPIPPSPPVDDGGG